VLEDPHSGEPSKTTREKMTSQGGPSGGEEEGGTALSKVVSAAVGSAVTALAVTPLEVVKVRQQAYPTFEGRPAGVPKSPSPNVAVLCPRGCGTFVLRTGLGEYLTPRSRCGYFDPSTGALRQKREIAESRGTFTALRRIYANEGLTGIYVRRAAVPIVTLLFRMDDRPLTLVSLLLFLFVSFPSIATDDRYSLFL
jgi:hypothetical protein